MQRTGLGTDDDRNLAMLIPLITLAALVFSGGVLAFAVPLVAFLFFRDRDTLIVEHARAALNFQLSLFLLHVACWVFIFFTFGIGSLIAIPVLVLACAVEVLVLVIAANHARRGETYTYPFALEILK